MKAQPSSNKEERLREKLRGILEWQDATGDEKIKTGQAWERYRKFAGEKTPLPDKKKESLILEAEVYYSGSDHLERDIEELFLLLEQTTLERGLEAAMKALREAERQKKEEAVEAALAECHEASKRLNEVKHRLKQL